MQFTFFLKDLPYIYKHRAVVLTLNVGGTYYSDFTKCLIIPGFLLFSQFNTTIPINSIPKTACSAPGSWPQVVVASRTSHDRKTKEESSDSLDSASSQQLTNAPAIVVSTAPSTVIAYSQQVNGNINQPTNMSTYYNSLNLWQFRFWFAFFLKIYLFFHFWMLAIF